MLRIRFSQLTLLLLLLAGVLPASAQAQLTLSTSDAFTSDDRAFERIDTLYLRVTAPQVDYADLDRNEWRLQPDEGGGDVEGRFRNQYDGTYLASVGLERLDPSVTEWTVRVRIEDDAGRAFRAEVDVTIGADGDQDDDGWDDDGDVEVEGTIDAVSATLLTVRGVTFQLDDDTRIRDDDDRPLTAADLRVGQRVEVHGTTLADGTLLARTVEVEDERDDDGDDDRDDDGRVEVRGPVEAVTDTSVTVRGLTFLVTAATQLLGDDDEPITLARLVPGTVVEVKGLYEVDGRLVARVIEVEDGDGDGDEVELRGRIEALSADEIVVARTAYRLTEATVVEGDDGERLPLDVLAVGMVVEVKGRYDAAGELVATRIEIEDPDDDDVELTGRIDALEATRIVVAGVLFTVNDSTVVTGRDGRRLSLDVLAVGQLVEVEGNYTPFGLLVATRIHLEDRVEDEVELTGAIYALGDGRLTVLGRTFVLLPTTVVLDADRRPMAFADLRVGDVVEVRGELQPGGDLVAHRIQREDDRAEVEAEGPITALDAEAVTVLDVRFATDAETRYENRDGESLRRADLQVGQTVKAWGTRQADGTVRAVRVQVREVRVATGMVEAGDDRGFTLLGTPYVLAADALLLDADNAPLTSFTPAPGAYVEVRAVATADGAEVTRLTVYRTAAGTAVAPEDEVPAAFTLEGNYPNPFNPSTTIRFTLRGEGAVQLTVHDVLGRRVQTLVAGTLPSGVHEVTWNGRTDAARPAASGMYLVRLESAGQVQTRAMLLVK